MGLVQVPRPDRIIWTLKVDTADTPQNRPKSLDLFSLLEEDKLALLIQALLLDEELSLSDQS